MNKGWDWSPKHWANWGRNMMQLERVGGGGSPGIGGRSQGGGGSEGPSRVIVKP